MSKLLVKKGKTSKRIIFSVRDSSSSTGGYKSGLTNSSFAISYNREDDGNAGATTVSLSAGTRGTWSSGGIVEKDSTNAKGDYEFGMPNAALASGSEWVTFTVQDAGANNIAPLKIEIHLTDFDPQDAVHMGLSALPNTACTGNASLITSGSGTDQLTVSGGIASADAKKINAVSTSSVTTVNANVGTTQPTNFSGTGSTAYVKSDVEQVLTVAPTLDANNVLNVSAKYVGGTLQTAGDIPAKTNSLAFTVANQVDCNPLSWKSGTIPATNIPGVPLIDLKYTLGTISPATAGSVRADQVTGAVGSVTGAVGSVTAAVTVGGYSAGQDCAVRRGTAQAGGASTITLDSGASATDHIYERSEVAILSGTGAGQANRVITGYVGATKVATVTPAWTTNPDSSSVFAILPAGADVETIKGTASTGQAGSMGIDWGQVANPTMTLDLSGTTIKNVDNAIATVTNLTNAPTNGDFTATMKTSLNAATPASITGSVAGDVQGKVLGGGASALVGVAAQVDLEQIGGDAGGITGLNRSAKAIGYGTVGTGSTTTSIVTSAITPAVTTASGQFNGRVLIFDKSTTTANLRGQAVTISAATTGGVLTVSALTDAPVASDSFTIT